MATTTFIAFADNSAPLQQFRLSPEQFDPTTEAGRQAIEGVIFAICPTATVFQVQVETEEQITLGGETYSYSRFDFYVTLQDYYDSLSGGSE
ncbi:hypothetical protein SEA_JULIETTE_4 [Mycobacterium phage Juliette]|uniref:Uncharacterized protein n=1 Tax=Mycobacterium phage Eponine TaxID=2708631 RepID=A0A6G6XSK1_9CAUD|nr:hypothetical protein I5G69_gp04 [Mycobacterium phage Eponine]QIG61785.1 hypothetical protein SEA_EPONINE_4 [Mycobacterium phage Eponine]QTF81611.1 hypothetical protein SEA_JULIETTE_4 [Mycobacterium phage Juliette]